MRNYLGENENWLYDNVNLYSHKSVTWLAWEILRKRVKDNRAEGYFCTVGELKKTMWSYAMRMAYTLKQESKLQAAWLEAA